MSSNPKFSFIVVCYERYEKVQCLIHSLLSQTYQNFEVILIHDGYDAKHEEIIKPYLKDTRFQYRFSPQRYNNWGMSLRNQGMEIATGDWIIHTNDDNYYVPIFLQELKNCIDSNPESNFIYYDCVLSHANALNHNKKNYGLLIPKIQYCHIDMGQFATKKEVICKYKFQLVPAADGLLVEEMKKDLKPSYIDKILFVHN